MTHIYAPGCALVLYKPRLAEKIGEFLGSDGEEVRTHSTCCRHEPGLDPGSIVINTCPGCDRRYRELYEGVSTISVWEILAGSDSFEFPDHGGVEMAVHDACPTRTESRVHVAVRQLLERMNIKVVEPDRSGEHSVCCGDRFYGEVPGERLEWLMKKRAGSMPREDVVVYCVSCIKAMHIGGKRPRYLIDLLFEEETVPGVCDPDAWHAQVDAFIDEH